MGKSNTNRTFWFKKCDMSPLSLEQVCHLPTNTHYTTKSTRTLFSFSVAFPQSPGLPHTHLPCNSTTSTLLLQSRT